MVVTVRWLLACLFAAGCGRIGFDLTGGGSDATTTTDSDPATFTDLTDPTAWDAFDLATLPGGTWGYSGAGFDGRYLYFVPGYDGTQHGKAVRLDTQAAFADLASWQTFDIKTIDGNAGGFNGGLFDGRYMYFVPTNGRAIRFDTTRAFTDATAWSSFDTASVNPNATGFDGARFDGRYVYLIPYNLPLLARYDTQAAFATASSWEVFDLSTVAATAPAYVGAVFDGRYLYFVPFLRATTSSGLALRFDTQGVLTAPASWSMFDTTALAANAKGFCGGAFDGRYLYFAPFASAGGVPGDIVVRLDTTATFDAAASWSTFPVTTVDANARGFFGATYDGRYVYFAPYSGNLAARYDTSAPFADASAWRTFDVTGVAAQARDFYGAAFDGGTVYFLPHGTGTVARFSAKTPASMPSIPGFGGSFW